MELSLQTLQEMKPAARLRETESNFDAKVIRATLQHMVESDIPEVNISEEIAKVAGQWNWMGMRGKDWKGVRTFAVKNYRALREANPVSAFGQLLRAGISPLANGWYLRYMPVHEQFCSIASSDKRQEFYAPLYRSQLPSLTAAGEPYRENKIMGVDREIINLKFMGGESFQRELFDDDQTGQIRTRSEGLGEAMRVLEDAYAAQRFFGTAGAVGGTPIPVSSYSTVNANGATIANVFDVNLYATGEGNRPASYAQLTYGGLVTAFAALRNAKDPNGIKMNVVPDTLLVSIADEFNAWSFINSTTFPAVGGLAGETSATASAGYARNAFGENPLKGKMKIVVMPYWPTGAWALGCAGKGFVKQVRDPLEVVQELPQSGLSFQTDSYRFRSRSRWEFEWIDSRFWYLGSDGTGWVGQ